MASRRGTVEGNRLSEGLNSRFEHISEALDPRPLLGCFGARNKSCGHTEAHAERGRKGPGSQLSLLIAASSVPAGRVPPPAE